MNTAKLSRPVLFSFILLCLHAKAISQSSQTTGFKKLKNLYHSSALGCSLKPKQQCAIYFRKKSKALDIAEAWIPLPVVSFKYVYSEKKARHYIQFECIDGSTCLYNGELRERGKAVFIPFITKQACIDFIDALTEFKITQGIK